MKELVIPALIISLLLVVALYIFILPDKKRASLNKFFKVVHDFLKIKRLIVESIFRFIYVLCVAFTVVFGIFELFDSPEIGLLLIIFGPIVSRIVFELSLLAVLLVKNVIEINNHLKGIDETTDNKSEIDLHDVLTGISKKIQNITESASPEAPSGETQICSGCGQIIPKGSTFCTHCGKRIDS